MITLLLTTLLAATPADVTRETVVPALRAEVFRAFTTVEGATTFFAPAARIELRPGGPYELFVVPDAPEGQRGGEGCRVLSYVPNEVLSFTWNAPPSFPELRFQRTFVVVQLSDAGKGKTRVKLTHGGWKDGERWEALRAYFDKAWGDVLGNLEKRYTKGPVFPGTTRQASAVAPAVRKTYVYYVTPARAGFEEKPTPDEERVLAEHVAHIKSLQASGRLLFAGPSIGTPQLPRPGGKALPFVGLPDTTGIVVFEAKDDAEALATLEADPAVREGVFRGRVSPFSAAFVGP